MTITKLNPLADKWRLWLGRPISRFWCVMAWLGATATFFGLAGLLGGPTEGDAAETVYATWAIAHGNLACAYPPSGGHKLMTLADPFSLAAPLYPIVSGALAAVFRIGHAVTFPTRGQLGPQCRNAFVSIYHWSGKASVILPTIRLSYVTWFALMVGVIALLRSTGRGRSGWEVLTLFFVACTPPVLMCLTYFFHPQDLLAMALILGGIASSRKHRWFLAGVLLGLAFCSQQFALLVGAPLFVIAPASRRVKYALGALVALLVIDTPLIIASSGRAIKTVVLGSSRVGSNIRSRGGTVLWEANLHGVLLFLISRVAPIVAVMALGWWASKRLGPQLMNPVPLISLVALCLTMRMVFEVNLFGYYFMAIAVTLVLLDVIRGNLRGTTFAWLALDALAFSPVHVGFVSNLTSWSVNVQNIIPIVIFAALVISVIFDVYQHRMRLYKMALILIAAFTSESKIWGLAHPLYIVPHWQWQIVLVPTAILLAARPLLATMKETSRCESVRKA